MMTFVFAFLIAQLVYCFTLRYVAYTVELIRKFLSRLQKSLAGIMLEQLLFGIMKLLQ